MKLRRRIYYSEADKALMWDRWQQGESMAAIAGLFDRHHTSVQSVFQRSGGIRPPARRRSRLALTLAEREEISRGIAIGLSMRTIAVTLGRSPSTISREINRNGGRERYRANRADRAAWARSLRPKRCKLANDRKLARRVARKLRRHWSPEQIAGWLKRQYPQDQNSWVSHETIYRTLFVQTRGALKKELLQYLRSQRVMRRPQHRTMKGNKSGRMADAISIRERPATIEDRAVPGHWEGDLIIGSRDSQIATLVERQTRYVMLAKLDRRDTRTVVTALTKQAKKLPKELYKSLTWDRGLEIADHKQFTLATDIQREHKRLAETVFSKGN